MIILDTNVISEIFRPAPEPRVVDWLESLTGDVAITSITLAELLAGVRRLPAGRRRDELTERIDAALEPYRGSRAVLPFDDVAADRYADVLVARENKGAPISTADAQIAAICYGDVDARKTHLATALVRQACQNGIKARFTTAHNLVMTLRKAKNEGRVDKELQAHAKFELLAIDELGYLP